MAIYVYITATGELASYCPNDTDPVASDATLTAKGMAKVSGLPQLSDTVAWDVATHTTKTVTAPVAPQLITTFAWLLRFTPGQMAGARASSNTTIQQFLFALDHVVVLDLTTPSLISFMAFLVTQGLLTQPQVNAIMAPPTSVNGP